MTKIKHIVLLKFKADVSQEIIDGLFQRLAGLKETIPGILDFSGGPYSSGEGLHGGFTHGFIMTFTGAKARDGYLPHPQHEDVKSDILPVVDGVVAFDYEVG